ncbi:MAG: hypothetical protein KGJ80_11680 [Chloroflexota bacterium]|nr:hypothetical protein [Chloroflexota bacterium]
MPEHEYDGAGEYVRHSPDTTPLNYVMDCYTDWRKRNLQRPAQPTSVALCGCKPGSPRRRERRAQPVSPQVNF